MFRSKVANHTLNEKYYTLSARLPKQTPRSALAESFEGGSAMMAELGENLFIFALAFQAFSIGDKAGRTLTLFVRAL